MSLGFFWMAFLVDLPLSLVYWLFTRFQVADQTADGALAVLREQYARGEIDDEEYERRRARLTANR